jgi:hypothetical protein
MRIILIIIGSLAGLYAAFGVVQFIGVLLTSNAAPRHRLHIPFSEPWRPSPSAQGPSSARAMRHQGWQLRPECGLGPLTLGVDQRRLGALPPGDFSH